MLSFNNYWDFEKMGFSLPFHTSQDMTGMSMIIGFLWLCPEARKVIKKSVWTLWKMLIIPRQQTVKSKHFLVWVVKSTRCCEEWSRKCASNCNWQHSFLDPWNECVAPQNNNELDLRQVQCVRDVNSDDRTSDKFPLSIC